MSQDVVTGFKSIIDFKRRRSGLAIFCFYLIYMIIGFVVAGYAFEKTSHYVSFSPTENGMRPGRPVTDGRDNFPTFVVLFPILSAVYCVGFHFAILCSKKAWKEPSRFIAVVATLILSLMGSVFFGFILPSRELNKETYT